tara:strand:- start:250 stop:489 length:240 start_codon:yes stop_codon:yes gene_type:complete
MKKLILATLIVMFSATATAKSPQKSKFYDFSDQLIDGERKKPTALYTDAREQVKFDRLLTIKKSFIKKLLNTSKERVFK